MSYSSRPLPAHLRQQSTSNSASTGQSPILLARINEKKKELEDLKQLRDLSAALAGQMSGLEEKLATLSNGTEGMDCFSYALYLKTCLTYSIAVAAVLSNWHNVLRAISMASSKQRLQNLGRTSTDLISVKIPKPKEAEGDDIEGQKDDESEVPLPQTLVRIPTEHAPALQQQVEANSGTSGE